MALINQLWRVLAVRGLRIIEIGAIISGLLQAISESLGDNLLLREISQDQVALGGG